MLEHLYSSSEHLDEITKQMQKLLDVEDEKQIEELMKGEKRIFIK